MGKVNNIILRYDLKNVKNELLENIQLPLKNTCNKRINRRINRIEIGE